MRGHYPKRKIANSRIIWSVTKNLIIDIEETGSDLDGFDRAWTLGKLMVEAKNEAKEAGKSFSFEALFPAISAFKFSSSLGYRYRLLYDMFPNGDYDSDYSHTTMAELAQRAESPDQAREVYRRLKSADVKPTEGQVRAWGDSSDNLSSIIDAVIDRNENNHVESVRIASIMHGMDPVSSDQEIKSAIQNSTKS
ncbi:MAG: hypothetical protein U5J98_06855 [Halobacteriales archaeon]|nr:hypothetical protein [Halobacteriales archaeon]